MSQIVVAAFCVLIACNKPDPTAVNPPAALSGSRLSGVVRDEAGGAVAGAKVTVFGRGGALASGQTDATGIYALTVPTGTTGPMVAEADGYEPTERWLGVTTSEVSQGFRLYAILRVIPGGEVSGSFSEDNSLCGIDEAYTCRTVRVGIPQNGRLFLEAVANDSTIPLGVSVNWSYPCNNPWTSVPVTAGTELRVDIVDCGLGQANRFTLRTRLDRS